MTADVAAVSVIRRIWELAIGGDQNIDPILTEIQRLCEAYLREARSERGREETR